MSTERLILTDKDTICATVTAPGQAGIAVVRVSGTNSESIVRQVCSFLPSELESHRIYYGYLHAPKNGSSEEVAVDEVLVAYFKSGRSFTGETTFEISCHGSQVIASEILTLLCEAGARLATRGEFSYRAFMNGRIDLVQAESILDLIQSRSKKASQTALRQLQGGFSKVLHELLGDLTWILANLEANIDFSAEDIEIATSAELSGRTEALLGKIDSLLRDQKKGRILKSGYQVALAGRPNAGKSSLLNALLNEERAIVTEIAGTTRDLVDGEISVDGFAVTLTDTAGLRETVDVVEKIGVAKTLEKTQSVDQIFYLVDGQIGWQKEDAEYVRGFSPDKVLIVWNKADLSPQPKISDQFQSVAVSARTGKGIEDLLRVLKKSLQEEFLEDAPALNNARHFEGLGKIRNSLNASLDLMRENESPDLIALELQLGMQALHEVLGLVYDDQVMDRVFQEFCIGK
jgi:tRNA modification GTPase